ncbi:unnamed protein product [Brugia timori]|uniref:Uncharacterized protein n=1 Tax=Brugia timori TaxID=42155 RepID=A0A3P7TXH7_9BILA|nr:unnamed protein product [Brugia timori]
MESFDITRINAPFSSFNFWLSARRCSNCFLVKLLC